MATRRTYELLRRARDLASIITPETLVFCDEYQPDLSMFPDFE